MTASKDSGIELTLPGGASCHCSVRISRRCRNASLRVSELRGLELVMPPSYSFKRASEFVERSASWIERIMKRRAVQRAAEAEQAKAKASEPPLPSALDLKACGEIIPLDYLDSPKLGFVSVRFDIPGRLAVQGDLQDVASCRLALVDWLKKRAAKVFFRRAEEIALKCGFKFSSLRVKDQRGRWGSCSSKGAINLNFRLLLLEPRFLRHVIIHELSHTVELNHSSRFWDVVERFEPDAKLIRRELRDAAKSLPSWLERS